MAAASYLSNVSGYEPSHPPLKKGGRGDFSNGFARKGLEIPLTPPFLGKGGGGSASPALAPVYA